MFQVIDMEMILAREAELTRAFHATKPFRYLSFDNFLIEQQAWRIYREFPPIDPDRWVDSNGLHQKNKWTNPLVSGSVAERFFQEANSKPFLEAVARITGISHLLADNSFFGAGYHQTRDGGFLDVHVDFNKLKGTRLDRRLNLLLYLNPEWAAAYGGNLELWDMAAKHKLEEIIPAFNRCVVFETNDISYHGHPVPVNTGGKTTRKSLSIYYYTDGREDGASQGEHNTLYVNTEGWKGKLKIGVNAIRESARRLVKKSRS